jgi:fucose permease
VRLTLVRDRLTWITYGQLAIFGYFIYGFGPVVPLLRDEQNTTRAIASLHGTALAVGAIVGGTITPWLVDRFGRGRLMWVGEAGLVVSVLGLWTAHALPATLTWVVIASLSGTFVVNGVAAILTEHHGAAGSAAISEANAVAAAVGTISPLIVGGSVAVGLGWRPGLAGLVLAVAGLALVAAAFRVRASGPPRATAHRGRRRPLPRRYWLAWVSLVATGSVEMSLSLWVGDVLRAHAGVRPAVAAAAMSAVVGGMLVGRLAGARLLLRLAAPKVLLAALAVCAVGFTVFWLATAPWLALVGLLVCGLGVSLHYPLGIALAVQHSAGQPDLAAGRSTYAIGLDFGIAPFGLGALADRIGPHPAFLLVFVMLAVSAVAVLRLLALTRNGDPVGEGQQDGIDPVVGVHPVVELDDRPVPGIVRSENPAVA